MNLLKNVIVPSKIGNYFVFPERIIGIDLDKSNIKAIQIHVSGNKKVIVEKHFELNLKNENYLENSTSAIKNILSTHNYDLIKVSLPSYLVIFKELTLPFIDLEKIRSILDFEIEPILPFSIAEAVTDFIVINQDSKKNQTTVLVAVARKKDILELIEPITNAGIKSDAVIVDIIGIYGIFTDLKNNYQSITDGLILLQIENHYTNIAYLQNGKIKLIRSIQQGINHIIKNCAELMKIDFNQASEILFKFGPRNEENNSYNQTIDKVLTSFISNVAFTLNSFKSLLPAFSEIKKIVIFGKANNIKNFNNFVSSQLNISTDNFNLNEVLTNNNINLKNHLPDSLTNVFAVAYPSNLNENFNLLRKDLEGFNINLLKKQIISFFVLFLLTFMTLIGFSYLQIKKLRKQVDLSRKEVITNLADTFEITDPSTLKKLAEVINEANNKLNEEELIWFSFSDRARFSYLKYLQELSSIIDKNTIGLNLQLLSITNDLITLEGEVKDFKALEILENELNKSKLFSHVTIPQETKFTIKLSIKKNEEEK